MPGSPAKCAKRDCMQSVSKEETKNGVSERVSGPQDWEEVEVDIGWGTLRGKARGHGPHLMLGLHGWLDNANTFDLVADVLPKSVRFISLDFPGHGLSDHFPPGFIYDPRGYVAAIKRAVVGFGWKRFTLLGHSMGAVVSIMYAAVFPEDVSALISIDIIKTWSYSPHKHAGQLKKYITQYFDNEKIASQPALVYTEDELVKKVIDGSKSLDEQGAKILLERGAKEAESGKGLVLRRDLRAKTYFVGFQSLDVWIETARAITCPVLIIKAKEGHHYETEENYKTALEAFKQDCEHYRYHEMPGKHHIHLTDPTTVRQYLIDFLLECTDIGKEDTSNGTSS